MLKNSFLRPFIENFKEPTHDTAFSFCMKFGMLHKNEWVAKYLELDTKLIPAFMW
jgi:hypothetical protein